MYTKLPNNTHHISIKYWYLFIICEILILENMIISPQFFKNYIGYLLDSLSIFRIF